MPVAALRGRLDRASVRSGAYRLSTIDGWAMRLVSLFPMRSGLDPAILNLSNPGKDYPQIRKAAAILLRDGHLSESLRASYLQLIVDEYQDCNKLQHAIVYFAASVLPTCVLGDPMQAIFDFAEPLPHWDNEVCKHFPLIGELTTPWRWVNAGTRPFGEWLLAARAELVAGRPINLNTAPPEVQWVHMDGTEDHGRRLKAGQTRAPGADGTVLIIGDAVNPKAQRQFASQTPGAVTVESVDLRDLVDFAKKLDLGRPDALEVVVEFAGSVMINVGGDDLLARVSSLRKGTARREASDRERAAIVFGAAPSYRGAIDLLVEINREGGVRTHSPAVLNACIKTLRHCSGADAPPLYEAAVRVREQGRLIGRPLHKRSVGSTLLLKGLEADVAVILDADKMNARNLYVAMTRGSKKLVICSTKAILTPSG